MLRRRLQLIFALLYSFTCLPLTAEIYKSVGENGEIIFTDVPDKEDAEIYDTPEITTLPSPPQSQNSFINRNAPPDKKFVYQTFRITSPNHDQHITTKNNTLPIVVAVKPGIYLAQGHQLRIYLDGAIISKGSKKSVTAKNVYRGSHTIHADIVNKGGKVIKTSDRITIHVRHPADNESNPSEDTGDDSSDDEPGENTANQNRFIPQAPKVPKAPQAPRAF